MYLPKIIAHRGASHDAPENTMAAFREALKQGADAIELDIQLTKDGEMVVIHDETLDRTTDMTGFVKSYTLAELKKADAGSKFSPKFAGEPIPLLEEVFELLRGTNVFLNIELKTTKFLYEGIEKKAVDIVRHYGYEENTIFSSFNHYSLVECKRLAPEIKTGILYNLGIYRPWDYAKSIGADAINPNYISVLLGDAESRKEFAQSGVLLFPWTVDDEDTMAELMSLKVSGVITNLPTLAIKVRERFADNV